MSMALNAKNKLRFADGTISRPFAIDLLFGAWSRYNSMVISWILNAIRKSSTTCCTLTPLWRFGKISKIGFTKAMAHASS